MRILALHLLFGISLLRAAPDTPKLTGVWIIDSCKSGTIPRRKTLTVEQFGNLLTVIEVSENGVKFGTVGYEIILLYLAGLASLALGGAGPLSLDAWRSRPK